MKLKQQQQIVSSLSSTSTPAIQTASNGTANFAHLNLPNAVSLTVAPVSVANSNGHQPSDDLAGSSTIWTRSAASRAAQQQQQQQQQQSFEPAGNLLPPPPPMPPPNFSSTGQGSNGSHRRAHHHGHNHHQHALGKIVKPIPVSPMSSSSSSTHSSSVSHALHHQGQHLASAAAVAGHLSHLSASAKAAIAANQPSQDANELALTKGAEPGENFSLIAKYFASFPATRLKSTMASDLVQPASSSSPYNSQSQSPILNAAPGAVGSAVEQQPHLLSSSFRPMGNSLSHSSAMTTAQNIKSTPFMPFKKQSGNLNAKNANFQQSNSVNDQAETTAPTATTTLFLRSHTQNVPSQGGNHTTDHLCTNFKRMIKLNDQNEDSTGTATSAAAVSASSATRASNTPTGVVLVPSSAGDSSTEAFSSATGGLLTGPLQLANGDHHHYPCPYSSDISAGPMEPSRFGQIQMETRSTRKFLIKHHPYLQYNSNLSSPGYNAASNKYSSNSNRSLQNPMRPSMDLIKMKKLISSNNRRNNSGNANNTDDDDQLDNHESSPLLFNRSGRSSRSTNSQGHQQQQPSQPQPVNELEDSRLLKFIDTIPSSANHANRTATPTMGPPKTIPNISNNNNCPNSASSLNKSLRIANKRRQTKDSLDLSSVAADQQCKSTNKTKNSISKAQAFVNTSSNIHGNLVNDMTNKGQRFAFCMENDNCNCAGQAHDPSTMHDMFTSDDHFGSIINDDDCQEEDSSGYYSSYQSVDLISSSGASSGGDRQLTNKASLNLDHLIKSTDNAPSGLHDHPENAVNNESFKQPVPNHHYHTRYLTNYLQQSLHGKQQQSKPSIASSNGNKLTESPASPAASSPSYAQTTPTTRLRYQQQLAAAAAAAAKNLSDIHHHHQSSHHSHSRVECCDGDIDLDQIEND